MVLNETIDITQIPQIVNDALFGGGSDTLMAARLAVSIFILMMVMLPMILARSKPMPVVFVGIATLGFLTVLGWMDPYVMAGIITIAAALLAFKAGDLMG